MCGMAASQASGFQGLVFPLPEGQKLKDFLCAFCRFGTDEPDGGTGLCSLMNWTDGLPGREGPAAAAAAACVWCVYV